MITILLLLALTPLPLLMPSRSSASGSPTSLKFVSQNTISVHYWQSTTAVVHRLSLHLQQVCPVLPVVLSVASLLPQVSQVLGAVGGAWLGVVAPDQGPVGELGSGLTTRISIHHYLGHIRLASLSPEFFGRKLIAVNCHHFQHPRGMLPSQCALPGIPRDSVTLFAHSSLTMFLTLQRSMQPWPPGVVSMVMLPCDVSAGAIVV